jgi:hypothetical protein
MLAKGKVTRSLEAWMESPRRWEVWLKKEWPDQRWIHDLGHRPGTPQQAIVVSTVGLNLLLE